MEDQRGTRLVELNGANKIEAPSSSDKISVQEQQIQSTANPWAKTSSSAASDASSEFADEPEHMKNLKSHETKKDPHDDTDSSIEEAVTIEVSTDKIADLSDLPPDGGYGWVSCACVVLIMFSTWGANSAFGVFLAFYFNNGVFPGATKYDYALIVGMSVAFGQGCAPVAMVLTRIMGCKFPMYLGTCLLFLGFLLGSFATKLWHLYVTQGFLVGVSIALLYAPATTVIPGWFLKKRSSAVGFSLIGTGAGGVTYSLAVNKLIEQTGHQSWPLRVMAISCTITCIVSTLLLKQRNPPKPVGVKSLSGVWSQFELVFSVQVTRKFTVILLGLWFAFALFGYNLMIFTLSPYGVAKGLTSRQASLLTTIMNAAQCFGRPSMGFLGDKIGRMNITVILTAFLTTIMFAFWLNCHGFLDLLFFAICVGCTVGVANVMSTVLVADMVSAEDFLPAWSFVNSAGAPFLLVCEVIAQAMVDENNHANPYLHTQIFAGLCFFIALILILVLREIKVRRLLAQRLESSVFTYERGCYDKEELDRTACMKEGLESLLLSSPCAYFKRMFYPIKT